MKLGCSRILTKEQKLDLQLDALKKAGCENRKKLTFRHSLDTVKDFV